MARRSNADDGGLTTRESFGEAAAAPIDARQAVGLVTGSRRVFANWLPLTARVALDRVGVRSGRPLLFVTRAGTRVLTPNNAIARAGTYEVFVRDFYRLAEALPQLPARPLTVLDLGAQVGSFVLSLAEMGRLERAVCYEPSAVSHRMLERNIAGNHLGGRVEARRLAVAAEAGTYLFEENAEGSGSATMLGLPDATATFEAEAITLARAIADFGAAIDVVKVNIEGTEYQLFPPTSSKALAPVAAMLLEYHNVEGRRWEDLLEHAQLAGFELRYNRHLWTGGGILFLLRRG